MVRWFAIPPGLLLALPTGLLLALLPSTPITPSGAVYLLGTTLTAAGLVTAPWRRRRFRGITRIGLALCGLLAGGRVLFPPNGTTLRLLSLPRQAGSYWLNRLFDEQDIALFSAPVLHAAGMITEREYEDLLPHYAAAYREMRDSRVTGLSPFMRTQLGGQSPAGFDALVAEPAGVTAPQAGVIFLHGFAGSFVFECWPVAQPALRIGAIAVCPSLGPIGDWWNPPGEATLRATIDYLRGRGVRRIYLAGLSNGGFGVSALAPRFQAELAGLIFISGVDPTVEPLPIPTLILHGRHDERIPVGSASAYARRAGPMAQYEEFESDHFALLKVREQMKAVIGDWLTEQEARATGKRQTGSERPVPPVGAPPPKTPQNGSQER